MTPAEETQILKNVLRDNLGENAAFHPMALETARQIFRERMSDVEMTRRVSCFRPEMGERG